MKPQYTPESLDKYYDASAEITKEWGKFFYEAEKNYKQVKEDLYKAKVKAMQQAEYLLVLKGEANVESKERND